MEKIDFRGLAVKAAQIADDKKAVNTVILDVRSLTAISDYFVVTTAESSPQINAIAAEIEKTFKEEGVAVVRREGISSQSWRVIDYGGLVVHIMSPGVRETYELEKLWKNASVVGLPEKLIVKIKDSKQFQKVAAKAAKTVNAEKKKVERKIRQAKKAVKKAENKIKYGKKAKTIKKTVKKADSKVKTAKKTVKKSLKAAGSKIKKVKKTIKAVGKGVQAFRKTMKKK
ncbi:ribosome silencing factor [Endomicrobium proavitum]|uniref:Ribosomal silencing factor RsfS n=1 Tax=Endomicrobium proavitum TaxID=1408281 RepID=A0A0G3WJ74_9BACT|nr:ribosome silencing factor [Endomicrobium proavitum]AKL98378.1 Ribosomal silencing factor RsfS (modular protein) [Endomicrobium proavitum]